MITDYHYQNLIRRIHEEGDELETRNYRVKSCFDLEIIEITETPLVTLRKTAWKKALRELEWFMSGDRECPEELLDWWHGQLHHSKNHYIHGCGEQLDPSNDRFNQHNKHYYIHGYGEQLRHFNDHFDQIDYILKGIRNNPNSRRLCMTVWHSSNMACITQTNQNENTPTCCHFSFVQYFVRNNCLHAYHYQRSADVLLGLPHNFIQHWALLLYFAHHANLYVGSLRYQLGDAHLYQHPSHVETVKQLLSCSTYPELDNTFELLYNPAYDDAEVPAFKASDFMMYGAIPDPKVMIRPCLL